MSAAAIGGMVDITAFALEQSVDQRIDFVVIVTHGPTLSNIPESRFHNHIGLL